MELLDFYADWCGPCQMMKDTVEAFAKLHPEVKVTPVNVDVEDGLAERYEVAGIPCFVLVKDGKEIAREVGVVPLKKLVKMLEKK